ncbi:MAG: type II secretion system F family protein [Eubacteriales bacterium]
MKFIKVNQYFNNIAKKISELLPTVCTGKEEEFRRLIYKLYGDEANFSEIENRRFEISKRYVAIFIGVISLLGFFFAGIAINKEAVVFEKGGNQYISRSVAEKNPKSLQLEVSGKSDKETINKKVSVVVNPAGYIENKKLQEERRLRKVKKKKAEDELKLKLYMIGASDDKSVVKLPKTAGSIRNLTWSAKKDRSYVLIIILGISGIACVYGGRYDKFKKMEKSAAQSVEKELSEFFNKLVLLINAGMVFTSAFEKTVDYVAISDNKSYFYDELRKINKRSKESNACIATELKKFSKRTENKEFIRIVNVISDNIHRGTELVKAMQTESELLSYQRRKRAEERARIAETKLTIPLAMQLLSLILITLAPAMLDM